MNIDDIIDARVGSNPVLGMQLNGVEVWPSIDQILVGLVKGGARDGEFTQTLGSAPGPVGEEAIDTLVMRGWLVNVVGGYPEKPGRYFTNFVKQPAGSMPSDWTDRYIVNPSWAVADIPSAGGGRALSYPGEASGSRSLVTWDRLDSVSGRENAKALARVRWPGSLDRAEMFLAFRASGATGSVVNMARHGARPTEPGYSVEAGGYSAGSTFLTGLYPSLPYESGKWYYVLAEVDGDNHRVKVWEDVGSYEDEPEIWQIDEVDPTITGPGWLGIFRFRESPVDVDFYSVGIGGVEPYRPKSPLSHDYPPNQTPLVVDQKFPSGDYQLSSISTEGGTTTVRVDARVFEAWGDSLHVLFRLSNAQGQSPEVAVGLRSNWRYPGLTGWHRLAYTYDIVSGQWFEFDNMREDGDYWVGHNNQPFSSDTVYVSTLPMYSYEYSEAVVDAWIANPLTRPTVSANSQYELGVVPDMVGPHGKVLPAHTIRSFSVGTGPVGVCVTAGVHPDEIGGWFFEGLINKVLEDSPIGVQLRSEFTFHVYPNLNPHGLYGGYVRIDPATGSDANRGWGQSTGSSINSIHETAWAFDLDGIKANIDFHSVGIRAPSATPREVWHQYDTTISTVNQPFLDALAQRTTFEERASTAVGAVRGYIHSQTRTGLSVVIESSHADSASFADWTSWGENVALTLLDVKAELAAYDPAPATDPIDDLLDVMFATNQQGAVILPVLEHGGQPVMFQDAAGTVPASLPGEDVLFMRDLGPHGRDAATTWADYLQVGVAGGTPVLSKPSTVGPRATIQVPVSGERMSIFALIRFQGGASQRITTLFGGNDNYSGTWLFYRRASTSPAFDDVGTPTLYVDGTEVTTRQDVLDAWSPDTWAILHAENCDFTTWNTVDPLFYSSSTYAPPGDIAAVITLQDATPAQTSAILSYLETIRP